MDYLVEYKNLARFQQQGWEALNQLLKHFFYKNTNKGGAEGKDKITDVGKHAKALARLCLRRILWYFGIGDEYFNGIYLIDDPILKVEDIRKVFGNDLEAVTDVVDAALQQAMDNLAGVPGGVDVEDPVLP